jgi:hypothetical protein
MEPVPLLLLLPSITGIAIALSPTPPPLPYATATHRITTTARVTGTDLCVLSTRLRGGEIRRGFDRWREIMHR